MQKTVTSVFIILFLGIWKSVLASPQLPDYIIYKGDTLAVYELILEQYLENIGTPNQGDLFGLKFREGSSLNCWRGYQAIYSIENDSLFLKNIIHCGELFSKKPINQEDSKKRIQELLGSKFKNNKVFIDWYSGSFGLPNGDLLRWDGVFYRIFEKEILIDVKKGKIELVSDVSNYEDKPDAINRRYKDKISDIMFKELEKVKWKSIDKFDQSEKYFVNIGKNGMVSDVSMVEYQEKDSIAKYWDKPEYNYCIRTILQGLKNLKFDVVKKDGEPIEEKVYIEIWLEDGKLENWTN